MPASTAQDPRNPPRSSSAGFTLLEVLIVVAVIGMLAALAVPSLMSVIRRSRIEGAAQTLTRHILEARAEAIYRGSPVIVHPDLRLDDDGNERHYLVAWVDVDDDGKFGGNIEVDGTYTADNTKPDRTVDYPLYEWELPWTAADKTFRNVYFWGAADADPTVAPAMSNAIDSLTEKEDSDSAMVEADGYGDFERAVVFLNNGSVVQAGGIRIGMGPFGGGNQKVNFLELRIGPQATGRVELRKFIPTSPTAGSYQPKGSASGQNGYAYDWEWY
jgi:prepilin-type N-terminal cleavage/methylation domain-containing protein